MAFAIKVVADARRICDNESGLYGFSRQGRTWVNALDV